METLTQPLCAKCEAPFEPVPYNLPGIGGTVIELQTTLCTDCARTKRAEEMADFHAAKNCKSIASLARPKPADPVQTACVICGETFTAEAIIFPGDGKSLKDALSHATVCDECATVEAMAKPGPINPTQEDRRRKMWVGMTGIRYADFSISELPAIIRPYAERVLAWTVQPKGVGLLGPSRSGKSPLMYALGQKLFLAGHDVMPTSGIEFQRKYQRSFDRGESDDWTRYLKDCEKCAVLLIDDADKLNLTPGVEAEYYGMLEHRRNWQLPVLCTLNMSGDELKASGRSDRSAAIVERLRDLCEFYTIKP
jgi:hypothetical protein